MQEAFEEKALPKLTEAFFVDFFQKKILFSIDKSNPKGYNTLV